MDNLSKQFIIYQEGNRQMIYYPRFKGVITFNSPISDIEDIEVLEPLRGHMDLIKALREAGEFILSQSKG